VPLAGKSEAPAEPGLKKGAISFASNVVIGVASTAPGYSLAATLGFVTAVVGFKAPAIMIVAFLPMLCIALAYNYMNRANPDCGTTFTWVTQAMGPRLGWMGGWAIIVADVIVMANLSQIAGLYSFQLFGNGSPTTFEVTLIGVLYRRDDVDLLARHRAVRPPPAVPARRRVPDADDLRGGRAREGVHGRQPGVLSHRGELVLAVRTLLKRPDRGCPVGRVHLLGVGQRCGRQ
jgi:hypothetical protein